MSPTKKLPSTLLEAIRYFEDPDTANEFVAALRWPNGPECPSCGGTGLGFIATRRLWKCRNKECKRQFSVKVGTIFEDSPIPLDKWLAAVWLIANAKNGISSYELHRDLKITQKSAWFVLHRIRLAMQAGTFEKIGGPGKTVEADESWVGGEAEKMNRKQREKTSRGGRDHLRHAGKAVVFGML